MSLVRAEHAFKRVDGSEHHLGQLCTVRLPDLQRQHVFQFMGDFAQLLKTTSGRVALEGMDGASHTANEFFIRGTLFQLKAGIVDDLETVPPRSQKRAREVPSSDPRAENSRIHLKPLVSGSVVFVNHLEFLRQTKKAFRVADKQVSAGIQAMPELFDQALLLGFVEIDHHVAAEDDVVAARQEFGLQVVEVELDQVLELWLDGVLVARTFQNSEAGWCSRRAPSEFRCRRLPGRYAGWRS